MSSSLLLLLFLLHSLALVNTHGVIHPLSQINVRNIPSNAPDHLLRNSPQMSVHPSLLMKSGETVTVNWQGISYPSTSDWIGVYSPDSANRSLTSPIEFQWANASSSHLTSGSGSLQFKLTNMRAPYSFTFFQNGLSQPIPIVTSSKVEFQNYNEPLQGRLSLTSKLGEMRVMWSARDAVRPQVKWGKKSGSLIYSNEASFSTFSVKEVCGDPATSVGWRDPGLILTAFLTDLEKGKRYYYIYGDEEFGWSKENSFVAPLGPDPEAKVRFYAYGDMGQAPSDFSQDMKAAQPGALYVTDLITKDLDQNVNDTYLALHIGDLSYSDGFQSEWDQFCEEVSTIATRLAYMTCPGNHESDWPDTDTIYTGADSGGECGVPFYKRFPIPDQRSNSVHWYSFDHGPVHIIVMSTEHDFRTGSAQYKWLVDDLSSVNRQNTPWLLFTGHRPMYVDSTYSSEYGNSSDESVSLLMQEHLEPLLMRFQVDVCFWGHHHSYQRTCFVYNSTCLAATSSQPQRYTAPVHFVIGMAGARLSLNLEDQTPPFFESIIAGEFGYTILEIDQDNFHLQLITREREVREDFWIKR